MTSLSYAIEVVGFPLAGAAQSSRPPRAAAATNGDHSFAQHTSPPGVIHTAYGMRFPFFMNQGG